MSLLLCSFMAWDSIEREPFIFEMPSMAQAIFRDIVFDAEPSNSKTLDFIEFWFEHLISINPFILLS